LQNVGRREGEERIFAHKDFQRDARHLLKNMESITAEKRRRKSSTEIRPRSRSLSQSSYTKKARVESFDTSAVMRPPPPPRPPPSLYGPYVQQIHPTSTTNLNSTEMSQVFRHFASSGRYDALSMSQQHQQQALALDPFAPSLAAISHLGQTRSSADTNPTKVSMMPSSQQAPFEANQLRIPNRPSSMFDAMAPTGTALGRSLSASSSYNFGDVDDRTRINLDSQTESKSQDTRADATFALMHSGSSTHTNQVMQSRAFVPRSFRSATTTSTHQYNMSAEQARFHEWLSSDTNAPYEAPLIHVGTEPVDPITIGTHPDRASSTLFGGIDNEVIEWSEELLRNVLEPTPLAPDFQHPPPSTSMEQQITNISNENAVSEEMFSNIVVSSLLPSGAADPNVPNLPPTNPNPDKE
jgi:hypothetical protein